MINQNKRDRLIDSAAELFHRFGLTTTSLADIAKHADIPIGNVYYYFKTKDELAIAAIDKRRKQFQAAFETLNETFPAPRQRLTEMLGYYDRVRDEYTRHGCPIGRIIEDADTEKDTVARAAAEVFDDFLKWAGRQFEALGHSSDAAKSYAITLLAGIEGCVIMAKAFNNPQIMTDELARLTSWLESLPNKRISLGKVAAKAEVS
ncbi:MAG: TetR/AcrR family transcriptional regulator [Alphaproteobacteria bacterium]